jgi:electron transport complex protein RnfG
VLILPIARNAILLACFAVCATAVIAGTYLLTRDTIAEQKRLAQEKVLLEIVPRSRHDNAMLDDTIAVGPEAAGLGLTQEKQIYRARLHGEVVAVIVPVIAPDGFSGDIEVMVGVNADGTVAGVRALAHQETPGLGDNIELAKSDWILGFNGKSLLDPALEHWHVKKDNGVFDQFTGATITPRAIVAATLRALQFAAANRKILFDAQDAEGRNS